MDCDPVLDQRLQEWGAWCINVENNRIGYPPQSPIVALMEVGIFTANFGPREPFLNPRAMEVSLLVRKLAIYNKDYAQALYDNYLYPNMPRRAIAQARGISVSTFKARVLGGKTWLSGAFDAIQMEKDKNSKK